MLEIFTGGCYQRLSSKSSSTPDSVVTGTTNNDRTGEEHQMVNDIVGNTRCCSGLWCVGCGFMVVVVDHSMVVVAVYSMVVVVPVSSWRLNGVLAH